jgi:hypothetical protein
MSSAFAVGERRTAVSFAGTTSALGDSKNTVVSWTARRPLTRVVQRPLRPKGVVCSHSGHKCELFRFSLPTDQPGVIADRSRTTDEIALHFVAELAR